MPTAPPGLPTSTVGASGMPPEVLRARSQKWLQLQNRRYGEKRKTGFIDSGKQVNSPIIMLYRHEFSAYELPSLGTTTGACPQNYQGPR